MRVASSTAPYALQVRSHASLGYAAASVAELVERAAALGLAGLALTDLENLYGQVELHHRCAEHGLQPLTGVELRPGFRSPRRPGSRHGRVVLLARDRRGYGSLCRIVTRRRCADGWEEGPRGNGSPAPACERRGRAPAAELDPVRLVAADSAGLFVLSDDPEVVSRLLREGGLEREALRLLLPRPARSDAEDRRLQRAAERLRVPLVAALDAVLAHEGQWPLHLVQVAVQRGRSARAVRDASAAESRERRLRSPGELRRLFADLPGALEEAAAVAEACDLDLRIPPSAGGRGQGEGRVEASRRLRSLCGEALRRQRERGRCAGSGYQERLERELSAIARLGFSGYLLAVHEVGSLARGMDVEVTTRGSAVGCLVLHLLGLSPVDPVGHGLCFERFINARRARAPDVDLDVCSSRRDELLAAVHEHFGPDHVALLSTLQTFGVRSALREGLEALEAPAPLRERLCDRLASAPEPESLEAWLRERLPRSLRRAAPVLAGLVGMPRHLSTHPGGIVVADTPLSGLVPLERAPGGWRVTQYDVRSVAATGLLKIDLLGNRCLTELRETAERVRELDGPRAERLRRGGLDAVPLDDRPTLEALSRGDTVGCFQFETPAVRAALAGVPVRCLSDAVAVLALVRPGPAAGEAKERFVARAQGRQAATPPHSSLQEVLRDSRGLLLYEEDVLRSLSRVAGVDLARADELREAVVASDGGAAALRRLEGHFLALAAANGFGPDEAGPVWREVERFAAYSFSKAHASSYGRLGYLAAYMRTHFPVQFGCALLNHHGGLYPDRAVAAEVVRWGVTVRSPCVNRSSWRCETEPSAGPSGSGQIRLGLEKLRGLRADSARRLLETRAEEGPFGSVEELRRRVPLAASELRALVLSGACDRLSPLASGRYPWAHRALLGSDGGGCSASAAAGRAEAAGGGAGRERARRRYAALVRVRNELRYLGMHPSAHPMQVLRPEAEAAGCVTSAGAREGGEGSIRFAGLASAARRVRTRGGETMQFVTLEDETGLLEGVLFPAAWRRCGGWLRSGGPFLAQGELRGAGAAAHLEVERLLPFAGRCRK